MTDMLLKQEHWKLWRKEVDLIGILWSQAGCIPTKMLGWRQANTKIRYWEQLADHNGWLTRRQYNLSTGLVVSYVALQLVARTLTVGPHVRQDRPTIINWIIRVRTRKEPFELKVALVHKIIQRTPLGLKADTDGISKAFGYPHYSRTMAGDHKATHKLY